MRGKRAVQIILGLLLFISGVMLIFYPEVEAIFAAKRQKELIATFESLALIDAKLTTVAAKSAVGESESQAVESLPIFDEELVDEEQSDSNIALIELGLAGATGIISIPAIDLKLLIFNNANESSLKDGVGLIESDKVIGINNVGIAGHRSLAYGKNFNRLGELTAHDEIEVLTEMGKFKFSIKDIFVVDQKQVDILQDQAEPMLTLVTCTPIGAHMPTDRLIVQAQLIK